MSLRHAVAPFALLALLALLAPLAAAADAPPPAITVTGSGKVRAAPDVARIAAGVVTEAPRAADAIAASNAAMEKVMAALDRAGIERKFVQTSRFDVGPVYADTPAARPRGTPEIAGYRVSNQVQVEVRGVERVGGVLDALVAAGANDLGGIAFEVADPVPLLDRARRQAVADARRKAELYANEAGVVLGRVIRVDEGGGAPIPRPVAYARMEAASAVPIAPGELELGVDVVVAWSLAP